MSDGKTDNGGSSAGVSTSPRRLCSMTRSEIEYAVEDILITDGPDGHCDGADILTDFIEALLMDEGKA